MVSAAFFDLDRTILKGSSGSVVSEGLVHVGILGRKVPGQSLVFGFYEKVGEDRLSMSLARQSVKLAAGYTQAKLREAGEFIADRLADMVLPHARAEIQFHRSKGRPVVLATTSPAQILEPFAELLGFDAVIASRYRSVHGILDGSFENAYIWGPAKRDAVREWAAENDVDLQESWAYSDSYYDVPLLEAVGNPIAVNPDLRLRIAARRKGWLIRRFDAPRGVGRIGPFELQDLVMPWLRPEFMAFTNLDLQGLDHLPAGGPAILASNHRSYFDPLAIAYAAAQIHRPVRFLGKSELFDVPGLAAVLETLGVIRVDRGSGSDAPLEAAATELDAGEMVVLLPEGTIPRGEDFFDAELRGRSGVARLAQATGVPVVPIGLWGTENVWPRSSRVPRVWDVRGRPNVTIRVGEALKIDEGDPRRETARIMAEIADLLPPDARDEHIPTAAELARTYPGGKVPEEA